MNKDLNLAQIFVATKAFLDITFFKNYSNNIDSSGLNIVIAGFAINKCKQNWQLEPETWDPAVWLDWIKAVNFIIAPKIADPANTLVSPLQGYQIMKKYIDNFAHEFEFKDLLHLFKSLDINHSSNFMKSKECLKIKKITIVVAADQIKILIKTLKKIIQAKFLVILLMH